jgi:hypothetical protein
MNQTLSTRQLRLVAVLGVIVLCLGGFLVVTRHKSTSPSVTSTPATTTPATSTPAVTTPAPTKAPTHTVAPVKLATHGLPVKVALALQKHAVVVVSLYQPNAEVDQITSNEAQQGAVNGGAGFVKLDVFHQHPGSAILHKLGVINTPAVLVIKRPGLVYSEFNGFVDSSVVEQAVTDAR